MTNWQLDQVADAVISLFRQREKVAPLDVEADSPWNDQLRFRSVYADLATYEFDCYPFVIHTTEPIGMTTREQREKAVREAGWNTFLLRSADVTIDLLTDSGTTAMSTEQWAAYDGANATPATSEAYHRFVGAMQEIYGYEYILPTHQGRAAEHIQSEVLIKPGQYVPGNMYFTTTKAHQELPGGIFVDIIVDEAHQPESEFPWKGNIDLKKLDAIVQEHGAAKVAYISFELSVNMAGGQPVSMDNLREVYAYCRPKGIPVLFDATRAVENAYFIQKRDPRYRSIAHPRHPARDDGPRRRLHGLGEEGLPHQHRRPPRLQGQRRVGAARPRRSCGSTRGASTTAASPRPTSPRWRAASRRCSTTATSAPASSRPPGSRRASWRPACRSSPRPGATRSSST